MDTQERIFYAATRQAAYMLATADRLDEIVRQAMQPSYVFGVRDAATLTQAAIELRWLAQK